MEAIILAGGFGKRLQCAVKDVPKPMAVINGSPFLSYLLDYLSSQGVNKVLLSVGYKYEVIKNYFGSRYGNLSVEYIIENKPLGTGGAVRESLERASGDDVIVLNGDTFFNLDLRKMVDFHLAHDSIITIAVKPMYNFDRYGTVAFKGNRITGFEEKAFKEFGYINGGVYVVGKKVSEHLKGYNNSFSFEVDFLQRNMNKFKISAFICDDYFIDIGVPEDYERGQKELSQILKE